MRWLSNATVPVLLCSVALLGCEGTAEPDVDAAEPQVVDLQAVKGHKDNPFLGSWRLTSAIVDEEDLVAGTDVQLIITYRSDLTHSVSVSNDFDALVCADEAPDCEWDGEYWYTATLITTDEPNHPNPEERGEDTSLYVFCGGKLFLTDRTDDFGIRLTLQRTGGGR